MTNYYNFILINKIFILFIVICKSEYEVKENVIPSYLSMIFQNLYGDIFPDDIKISLSISKMHGTLLYSVDSNKNQLIVNIIDQLEPNFEIEFNSVRWYVSIPKLCKCQRCIYEKIIFRIQIKDYIYISCNDGNTETVKYTSVKEFNTNYPIPTFNKTSKLVAYLWLINIPHYGVIVPNNLQLYGCIFGIWRNNEILKMENFAMGNKCIEACTPVICNSGECLETYNDNPVCDCTHTFKNGKFCNDKIEKRNLEITLHQKLSLVKLSFTSQSKNLFQMNNNHVSLELIVKETNLVFNITSTKPFRISTESVITKKYKWDAENIFIMVFNKALVEIKFYGNNSSRTFISIPYFDLSNEKFEKVVLRSGNEYIDFVYKTEIRSLDWYYIESHKLDPLPTTEKQIVSTSTIPSTSSKESHKLDPLPTTEKQIVSTSTIPSTSSKGKDKDGEMKCSSLSSDVLLYQKVNVILILTSVLVILIIIIIIIIIIITVIQRKNIWSNHRARSRVQKGDKEREVISPVGSKRISGETFELI